MTRQKQSPNGRASLNHASTSLACAGSHVPLAIIGMGCRYPGVSNPEELWQKLVTGQDLVRSYADSRFQALDAIYEKARVGKGPLRTDRGGFLEDVAGFDSQFFEISPREAVYLDPQQRLLLEVAWEALEDAGQIREKYDKSPTGVYMGLWNAEYETRLYESATDLNVYSVTGCGRASVSGRLSFAFGFEGPSVTVDTACSSSLVAVNMACEALWTGEIDMALAGGANVILGTEISEIFTKANMLAADGRCKFGDASADGFVRSEGAGVIVLKTLSRALADGDPIHALIRGSAVNNDGRCNGFMTPSSEGQQQMLREAWRSAGIEPRDVRFIEMHGTGTSVGDPIEIGSVGTVLRHGGLDRPCLLGSVKTNLGHTESASGVTGLIKAALSLEHRMLPPSLHLSTPNPKIPWNEFPVQIPQQIVDLSADTSPLIAGVNSFGLSGTNAHIVLQAAERDINALSSEGGPYLLPISARTQDALRAMIGAHAAAPNDAGYSARDVCYTAGARRTHHEYRAAIVGVDLEDLKANLAAALANEENEGVISGEPITGERKIVFIAPGQGSQWPGMARGLFAHEAVFRQTFQECDDAIAAETGWTLADRVLGPEADSHLMQIDVIQPALFAMSVSLAALWRSWGIEPDAIVGHSMGEVAAAHIAGILSLKDAVAVICRRSRLMKTLRGAGSMATIELPLHEAEALVASRAGVSIGASNGPGTTVISGDAKEVESLLKELEIRDIYCRLIKVDVASHSAQVDPILAELKTTLAGVRPNPSTIPMLSTVTAAYADNGRNSGTTLDAAYWADNLRRSVLFAPAIEKLCAAGNSIFIELSPHPILLPSTEASARPVNSRAVAVASLRREKPERATMLRGLGALYAAGCNVAWEKLYPNGRCVSLPQYRFQRERYWPEPGNPQHGRATHASEKENSLLGHKFESALHPNLLLWESELQIATIPYLNDHRVLRSAVFPASGHLAMAFSAIKSLVPDEIYEIQNASFLSAAYIPDQGGKTFQLALSPEIDGRFSFEIRTRADEGEAPWPLRSKGILRRIDSGVISEAISIEDLRQRYSTQRSAEQHYQQTSKCGLQYGPEFRLIQEVWAGDRECICRLQNCGADPPGSIIHPALLDACFQAILHVRPNSAEFQSADTYLPVSIERIRIHSSIPEQGDLFATAILTDADPEKGTMRTDLRLIDAAGRVLLDVIGMDVARVARENAVGVDRHLYSLAWIEDERKTSSAISDRAVASVARFAKLAAENWIVFADDAGVAKTMARSLSAADGRCTMVRCGPAFMKIAAGTFEIEPGSPGDLDRLFQEVSGSHGAPTAIVHLWSLNDSSGEKYDAKRLIQAQAIGSNFVPMIAQAVSRANWENPPRLWLVTAGAMPVGDDVGDIRIESAPMWGVGRGVVREHAELRASLVDLSHRPDDREARALAFEICANGKEDRVALRGDRKYVARLRPFVPQAVSVETHLLKPEEDYRVEISAAGILDNIELRECASPPPGTGEIKVQINEAGLNYNDVLKAMGLYPGLIPGQPVPLGNEAVGTVTAVGAGVEKFHVGDRVIAVTPNMRTTGMMATSVTVPAILAVHKPANLTDEQAATMTIVYATAYWALIDQARLRTGEWILIHAGAGGVGLAAIEIAKSVGANIIVTVGSKEKEDHLRSLGVQHVLNSRSLDFAAGVMEITRGRGVDVVLNSLAGEFLLKSLEVLAPYGRFVELGKRDVYGDSRVGLRVLRNNNSFHVVDVAAAVEDRQPYIAEILAALMPRFESGEWKPLPVTSFSSADPSVPFRFMAQAKHIGKISIRMDRDVRVLPRANRALFSTTASYLITGGLGGIALTIAEWMAKNGAGHLVLLSRRSVNEETASAIRQIQKSGAKVTVVRGDVTREADIADAMKAIHATGVPLKGILHTAAVVDDALIADVTSERFLPVLRPKIEGAWNLHTATKTEALDFFVLFSSIAAIHPQPGMGSYAAANAFLDAFAHHLRGLGRPAISVNWGGWDQIGLARNAGTERSFEGYADQGMRVFSAGEALDALRHALESNPAQMIAIPIDVEQFAAFHGVTDIPPAFSDLVSKVSTKAADQPARSEVLDQLTAAASAPQRTELLEAHLQEVLGRVLKLASHRIDRDRALGSMGLDSLMGLEFVRRLSHSLEIAVPATVVFNYPTIRLLTGHLLQRMHFAEAASPATTEAHRSEIVDKREQSVGELAELLSEEDALQALMGNESRSS